MRPRQNHKVREENDLVVVVVIEGKENRFIKLSSKPCNNL